MLILKIEFWELLMNIHGFLCENWPSDNTDLTLRPSFYRIDNDLLK